MKSQAYEARILVERIASKSFHYSVKLEVHTNDMFDGVQVIELQSAATAGVKEQYVRAIKATLKATGIKLLTGEKP